MNFIHNKEINLEVIIIKHILIYFCGRKKKNGTTSRKIYHKFLQRVRYNVVQLRTRVTNFARVAEYISFLRK
jgi:hypothetical protein